MALARPTSARPVIALLPLDERPVNTSLVADVAGAAGYDLALPPAGILSHFREGADTQALAAWLVQQAADEATKAIVVSIDMLVFGGLISARVTHEELSTVIARFDVLGEINRLRPELPLLAVSLVTRASNSNSNMEEPEYWSDFGTTIHALGADAHRAWQDGEAPDTSPVAVPVVAAERLPQDVRRDFASRRLRNHIVNLAAIDLRAEGVLDYLAVTADDTAAHSAGSVEQDWLGYWGVLDPLMAVPIYPGADETGAVLVSRALCMLEGVQPVVEVVMAESSGWNRIPPYENVPLALSIPRQIDAAGARRSEPDDTGAGEAADLILVVHPSDPDRGDQGDVVAPEDDLSETSATLNAVRKALERASETGSVVALADLRYANGADTSLVEGLRDAGLLNQLAAYGGWNTAGNALGSTIALGIAAVLAKRQGRADAARLRVTRARRLLDDYAYQAVLRREFGTELFHDQIDPMAPNHVAVAEQRLTVELQAQLEVLDPSAPFRVAEVRLPWGRRFEVDVLFDCEDGRPNNGRPNND